MKNLNDVNEICKHNFNLQKSIFKPKQTCERVRTSSIVDSM